MCSLPSDLIEERIGVNERQLGEKKIEVGRELVMEQTIRVLHAWFWGL